MSSGPVVNSDTWTPAELEVKAAKLEARRLEAARALALAQVVMVATRRPFGIGNLGRHVDLVRQHERSALE